MLDGHVLNQFLPVQVEKIDCSVRFVLRERAEIAARHEVLIFVCGHLLNRERRCCFWLGVGTCRFATGILSVRPQEGRTLSSSLRMRESAVPRIDCIRAILPIRRSYLVRGLASVAKRMVINAPLVQDALMRRLTNRDGLFFRLTYAQFRTRRSYDGQGDIPCIKPG